jgi:hypothetical protein
MAMVEKDRLPRIKATGRMPERSGAISGDEAGGATVVSAAQSESVKAVKLAKIAESVPTPISKEHKNAWARLDAGRPPEE